MRGLVLSIVAFICSTFHIVDAIDDPCEYF